MNVDRPVADSARTWGVVRAGYRAARWGASRLAQLSAVSYHLVRERFHAPRLIILDDAFPNPASGFRAAELSYLLDQFPTAEVRSTGVNISFAGGKTGFEEMVRTHLLAHPGHARRILRHTPYARLAVTGFYCLFLHNAKRLLPYFEQHRCGFAFTLYPGGGFVLGDTACDADLKHILASPAFRAVIVTQEITRRYLLDRRWCPPNQIHMIRGVTVAPDELAARTRRRRYGEGGYVIAFVAHKYAPQGKGKGYDRFVQFAQILTGRRSDVQFHVVGNFDETDFPLGSVGKLFHFHGSRPTNWLNEFLCGVDVIVSPNVPFTAPGSFDGFPIGCCVHAALSGSAVVCTDQLGENTFRDGEEIVIVPPDPEGVADAVGRLLDDPDRLARVAAAGQRAFREAYSVERQLAPRERVLRAAFHLPAGGPTGGPA